jgi:hypothetical protein
MKPTLEPPRNGILSSVPFLPEELLSMTSFFRYTSTSSTTEQPESASGLYRTAVDPSSAYGCVDWYIYPDTKPESAAA